MHSIIGLDVHKQSRSSSSAVGNKGNLSKALFINLSIDQPVYIAKPTSDG
jgi:hypothetical protein